MSQHSDSSRASLDLGLARLLVGCQVAAVLAVLLGLALARDGAPGSGAIAGVPLAQLGVAALLAGPFLALLGIALASLRGRHHLGWYALATLVVAAAGMLLAR